MPLINPPTATDALVKINGSSMITGPLKFNAIGSPSYSPWAFNGAIVIGTYTLHFAPTGGTTFDFSFTTTVVDPFSQALAFVAAFNADATVIANGFRAYDFNNQVNELGPTLSATNQWVFVGLRAINYVVTQVSSTAGIQTNGSPTPAIVGAYLQLKNLGSPTLSSDAISKGYVDGNFLNLSGAKPMTGSLSFIIGNPMTFGLGFVPTPTGAYTLTITPSVGSPFTFTYYASTSDHNAEAPLLVQYFNADASTKTTGFRAYDAFHSAPSFGEKIAFSFGNQFGIVGPNQVSFTVAISGNGALVSLGQTYAASSTINNYNITGLKDPVNPQDAATKAFVLANAGSSGANATLSNLMSPTSVNQGLIPSIQGSLDLGGVNTQWGSIYGLNIYAGSTDKAIMGYQGSSVSSAFQNNNLPSTPGAFFTTYEGDLTLSPAVSGQAARSAYMTTPSYNGVTTGKIVFATGNSGTVDSGPIILKTGTAGANRGKITLDAVLNLPVQSTPATPVNGDMWFDGTSLKLRVAGVTRTVMLV